MLALANKLSLNTRPIYRFVNEHSIDFDGVDDRIITDADAVAQPTTYSFWCKSSETGQNNGVFGHGSINIGAFHINAFGGDRPILFLESNYYRYWVATDAQDDGEWHHWVVYADTNDITNSKLYIDGVLQNPSATVSSGSTTAYTESLTIGGDRLSGGNSYAGKIDEFAVYDRELTQAEITRMYNTYYSPNRIANGNFAQIGNEEVTNGDFSQIGNEIGDLDTITNLNGAILTQVSGTSYNATSDGTGSTTRPRLRFSSINTGKAYKLTITPSNQSGTIKCSVNNDGTYLTQFNDLSSNLEFYFVNGSNFRIFFDGTETFNVDFTISLKEVGQDWNFNAGWSTDGTKAISDTGSGYVNINQTTSIAINKSYKVSFTVSDYSSGNVQFIIGNSGSRPTGVLRSANGTYTEYITVDSSTVDADKFFIRGGASGFTGSIDNISVKELGQHWNWDSSYTEGAWTTDGTKAICDGTQTGNISFKNTSNALVQGRTYKITYDISNYVSGEINPHIKGTATGNVSGNGTKTASGVAGSSSDGLNMYAGHDFVADIDNVIVQELKHDATNLMLNHSEYQSANPLITSTKSMEFDGSDDYLQLGEPFNYTNNTITGWFRVETLSSTQEIFSSSDSSLDGIRITIRSNNELRYRLNGVTVETSALTDNKWYNFAATYDGATAKIYLNGVLEGSVSASATLSVTTNSTIGKRSYTSDSYFDGQITELGVYNRALTALEVASLYNQGMPTDLLVNRNNYQSGNPTVFNTKQVDFDGTDDYLSVSDSDSLDIGTNDFSVSAWIKTTNSSGIVLAKRNNDVTGGAGYEMGLSNGKLSWYIKDAAGNVAYDTPEDTSLVNDGEWHHIAWVFDRNGLGYRYIDGVNSGTNVSLTGATGSLSNTGSLGIMARIKVSADNFLGGKISQAGIWNKALTADEVSSLYNHGLPIDLTTDQAAYASSANLTGYWRMGSGTLDSFPSFPSSSIVGIIADQTNATLGDELITCGDFSCSTPTDYWTLQTGWSIATESGNTLLKAELTDWNNAQYFNNSIVEANQVYKLEFDAVVNSGTCNIYFGQGFASTGLAFFTQTGHYELYMMDDQAGYLWFRSNNFNGTIDNISLKKVNGNPAIMTNQTSSAIENGSPYANIVTNGTFDTDSDWTKGTGWSIANGLASCDGSQSSSSNLYQVLYTVGKTYKTQLTVNAINGTLKVFTGTGAASLTITSAGTYDVTTEADSSTVLYIQAQASSSMTIDNVTVEEVNTGLQGYWKMGDGTNDEYPVIYDQVDPTLGSEIIIDTQFNDSNEWNISNAGGTTGWVVSNGQAIMNTDNVSTGRNLLADNSNNLTLGKTYKTTIDFADASGSGLRFGEFGGDFNNWTVIPTGTIGSYTFYRVSQYAGRPVLYALSVNQKINSITVKEVQGNGAYMTNMLEGNITNQYPLTKIRNYYRMGDGIMDGYPIIQDQTSPNLAHIPTTNLLLYSEDFSQSYWTKRPNITATYNTTETTSPIGTNNVTKFVGDGFDGVFKSSISVTGVITRSVYLKSVTGNTTVKLKDPNVSVGTTTLSVTTEWQRFEMTADNGTSSQGIWIDDIPASGIYMWGAQVEAQSQATAYLKSDGIAAVRKSSTTNLIPYSEDFGSWNTANNVTITQDTTETTDPLGTNKADKILVSSASTPRRVFDIITTVSGSVYTGSVYAKKGTTDSIRLLTSSYIYDVTFDLTNLTITETSGNGKIESVGNGWYRLQATGTSSLTTEVPQIQLSNSASTNEYLYLWGSQFEQQTQAETYAKTTGLPVTIDLFTENNYGTMTNMSASDIVEDTP